MLVRDVKHIASTMFLLWSCSTPTPTPTHVGSDGSVPTCDNNVQIISDHNVATMSSQSVGVPSNLCVALQPAAGGPATLTVSSTETHIELGILDENGNTLSDGQTNTVRWGFTCYSPCPSPRNVIVRVSALDGAAPSQIQIDLTYLLSQL
jgi:hypothetical protein